MSEEDDIADNAVEKARKSHEEGARDFSDDDLALSFSRVFKESVLYVPAWKTWLCWDGCRYKKDQSLTIMHQIRRMCRVEASVAQTLHPKGDVAKRIRSKGTMTAVEMIARADRAHTRSPEDFDCDPWLLNTPGGVVDLRTGQIRSPKNSDMFSKMTAVEPSFEPPEKWLEFLKQITQDNEALTHYLQKFIGYTLTGVTREHSFIFLVGPGGNGKGVLIGTIASILGDYQTTAMEDVFTVNKHEQHPTHLAALQGARLAAVTETEAGKTWAESRLKALTGGDKISARVMRGDPFEFLPQFKLWVSGNHKPVLRNPDAAMRRRLNLVPLTYTPPKPDYGLPEALKKEWPQILGWAIQGCMDWQKYGLRPPIIVSDATNEYFAEQDSLSEWFKEKVDKTHPNENRKLASRDLYKGWADWCEHRGEPPGTEKTFSGELQKLAHKKRYAEGVFFVNLKWK